MMGFAIVAGQLFPGFNFPLRIKLGAPVSDADKYIGVAGVVHKFEDASPHAAVNRHAGADFDDGDTLGILRPAACFADRNALASKLANFLSGGNGGTREQSLSTNPTFSNLQHVI